VTGVQTCALPILSGLGMLYTGTYMLAIFFAGILLGDLEQDLRGLDNSSYFILNYSVRFHAVRLLLEPLEAFADVYSWAGIALQTLFRKGF
jgi:hypothetical protein